MDDKSTKPSSTATMPESSSPAVPAASQTTPGRKPPIPVQRSMPRKLIDSTTSSKTNSPRPSREPSPARASTRSGVISRTGPRSSKGSSQDPSPSRSASGVRTSAPDVPSSAAIQRALSAANTPALKPSYSDSAIVTVQAGPSRITIPMEVKETPRWPISPRLRSPPPVNKIRSKDDLPSLTSLRFQSSNESSQSTSSGEAEQDEGQTPTRDTLLKSPARGPSTSSTTLETVQEISQPATPMPTQVDGTMEECNPIDLAVLGKDHRLDQKAKAKQADKIDSGSESGEKKSGTGVKLKATASGILRPTIVPTLRPAASGTFKKPSEGSSTKNMTVETETVSSVPIVAVGGGGTINGSIRAKPSSETIRPKKEKKNKRKQQNINAGVGEHTFAKSASAFMSAENAGRMRSKSRLHDHPTLPSREQSRARRMDNSRKMLRSREQSSGWESSDSSRTFTTPISHHNRDLSHGHRYDHYYGHNSHICGDLQPGEVTRPDAVRPFLYPSGAHQGSRLSSMSSYVRNLLTHPSSTASSKADIFEAKIASAVDEADSEDSEETFVYESNPPDHERPRRYHSRTPSATSMASAMDAQRQRSIHPGLAGGVREEGTHSVHGKKSMKFANSFSQAQGEALDDSTSHNGTGRGTIRHHHIGRWGRSGPAGAGPNGHQSLFDNESPFPNAKSAKFGGTNSRQGSRPSSPRLASNSKFGRRMIGPYDDEGDDERTPLISSSIRSTRSGRHRRPYSSNSSQSRQGRKQSLVTRFASCLVLSVLVLLVLTGAIGFLFATTQPLLEVRITGLKKVLASEGELMFDVEIEARNPNCLGVSVEGASLSVYARSKYANGAGDGWFSGGTGGGEIPARKMRRRGRRVEAFPATGKVLGEDDDAGELEKWDDSPFDPLPSDPDDDKRPLLLLGRITQFDNALYFEGSPFRHTHSYSTGEIRIENPGNITGGLSGDEGMDRWREVVRHEWDLIVQGLIRYELPLSRRIRSSQVRGRVSVEGGAGAGEGDGDLVDSDTEVVEVARES